MILYIDQKWNWENFQMIDHGIRRKAIQSNWTGPFLCPMRYLEIQGQCAYGGYP